ncbi:hypothetical protein V5799_019391 [Amblyomma americanum]|uniref:Tick transposon n=1 Tax=Amblyomma americanum TaxID=6943 RepID=A0AAQ4EWX3_AMBAM
MALEMVAAAWIATRATIIRNSFQHTGFATEQLAALPGLQLPEEEATLVSAWQELHGVDETVPEALDDFLFADEDVIVHEELTDDTVVKNVCGMTKDSDDEGGDDQLEKKEACPRDVLNALDTIRSFIGAHDR